MTITLSAGEANAAYSFIALHGALLDGRSLLALGQVLATRGDGLLPDLGGHGEAGRRGLVPCRFDPASLGAELAARPELSGWIAAQPPERPLLLLGHSLGALTALWLAVHGPFRERVERVLLLDPPLLLDLTAPGQGELLFDLGCAIGSLASLDPAARSASHAATVNGIAAFFLGQYRLHCAGGEGRQHVHWLREFAASRRCDLLVGLRQHACFAPAGERLDLGTLVGPAHVPCDLPRLHRHPIADAGHRLDTSAEALQLIASLVAGIGRPDDL